MSSTNSTSAFSHQRSCVVLISISLVAIVALSGALLSHSKAVQAKPDTAESAWTQVGFKQFSQGHFDDGGSNLYVDVHGVIQIINTLDVNGDGYPDLVLANSHDIIERGPTWQLHPDKGPGTSWKRKELANDSGWMSRVIDVDIDGFPDLVVVNGENGVTSLLNSYVYWGGPEGLTGERTEFPTVGAYDVVSMDLSHDGFPDLIFPSAWTDHHDPGRPLPLRVFLQQGKRKFVDATQQYGITGVAAVALATADLNGDGFPDLVVANSRKQYDPNTDSYVYWGTSRGLDTRMPLYLPTHGALQILTEDLNKDGTPDLIFTGGNQVQIFWNRRGKFDPADQLQFTVRGASASFNAGAIHAAIADLGGHGEKDLILATAAGIQIRAASDLRKVQTALAVSNASWVTAADLDGDGRPELVVSRYHDGVQYDTESPIFWNSPSGFAADRVSWVPTKGAMGNTVGNLEGNGRPVVVYNSTMSGHCCGVPSYIYLGNKEAQYSPEHRLDLPIPGGSYQSVIADLDLDGFTDMVFTTGDGLRIFKGGPDGPRPDRFVDLPTKNKVLQDVVAADFNHDGYLDLLAVLENIGAGAYLADVNRDGYLDVLFDDQRGHVLIYLGGPKGFSKDRVWKVHCPALASGGRINVADLNKDGWLDLIVSTMGHYVGRKDTLHIYYGSPDGFRPENSQAYFAGYSPVYTAVADLNRDGNLDLVSSAYSTPSARVIPAQIFWGNGKTVDFDHPFNLPAEGSSAVLLDDLNRDGWIDIFVASHRNDLGHRVDSLIYWNGPNGFSTDRVTRLPGLGPHGIVSRDRGNAYTREPEEAYTSSAHEMGSRTPSRIGWIADVAPPLHLRFQVRYATTNLALEKAKWMGPGGEGTYFERSGAEISYVPHSARWLQYRAIFVSPYGCGTPRLRKVRIDFTSLQKNAAN